MSRGIVEMERALMPCGKMAWPAYQLPSETRDFKSYFGACATGKCPKKHLARNSPFDVRRERRGIRTSTAFQSVESGTRRCVCSGVRRLGFESLW